MMRFAIDLILLAVFVFVQPSEMVYQLMEEACMCTEPWNLMQSYCKADFALKANIQKVNRTTPDGGIYYKIRIKKIFKFEGSVSSTDMKKMFVFTHYPSCKVNNLKKDKKYLLFGFIHAEYEPNRMMTYTCFYNKKWKKLTRAEKCFLRSNPDCPPPPQCSQLSDPAHGTVVLSNGTAIGSNATYSCNECLSLNGSAVRTCLDGGNWSGVEPTCEVPRCSDGWFKLCERCYRIIMAEKNQSDAEANCRTEGGTLASFETKEEFNRYVDSVYEYDNSSNPDGDDVFIDGRWNNSTGIYEWSNGIPVNSEFWKPGEPSNPDGNQCIEMVDITGLRAAWCSFPESYVCEKAADI